MRDSLTALAALVILVFVAALAIPPFVDWDERRLDLEAALSGAAGVPVETRGDIDLRLLPSPRLRVDGLTIGLPDGAAPSVVAQGVVAEMGADGPAARADPLQQHRDRGGGPANCDERWCVDTAPGLTAGGN